MQKNLKHFSRSEKKELMIVAAAREIADRDIVFVGLGLPLAAASLAKITHAPRAMICFESGVIDTIPVGNPIGIGDPRLVYRCAKSCGIFYSLSLLQRGYVDVSLLGGAEVDKYGNINSTVIGDYRNPEIRLPGSGGANDAASNSKRIVTVIPHEKRRFPEKVSFITSPGFIDGPGGRERAGLRGGGPKRVITDMAVMGFHPKTKIMRLESVHPGISADDVKHNTGFKLLIPKKVPTTKLPSRDCLRLLRTKVDPDGFFTGDDRK